MRMSIEPFTLTQAERFPSALCAQVGVGSADLWFPSSGSSPKEAKAICRRCPHVEECLAVALADPTLMGIWGATSAKDRQRLRSQTRSLA